MSSKRLTVKEVISEILCTDTEEDVSELEDSSEVEDNVVEDPDDDELSLNSSEDEEEAAIYTSSSERNSEAEQPGVETWMSKDGKIAWTSTPQQSQGRLPASMVMKSIPGPTRFATSRVHNIYSAFELFLHPIEKIVLDMTNLEGSRVFGEKWKPLDLADLNAYIGLLILSGVYKSNGEATESLWNAECGRPIFRATMSLERFHVISRVIRFDNRETRASRRERDKLAAIRDVWDKWIDILPRLYNPGQHVTVDERLVPFRGRCPFRQYMPKKPAKYGIKIWAACDANSSYAWNMQIYTGKPSDGAPERNQGMRVVLEMSEGLQGHCITCDNFFTSYKLGEELLKRKLTMIGTVKKNKPELPREILDVKERMLHSSKFAFSETTTVVSYCPKKKKNVLVMSTMHRDASLSARNDLKPEMVLDYNSTKGGVDNLDKVTSAYSCQRKTARWPLVVFYNILDVSAYNAFILWREINPNWNEGKLYKRRLFLDELGKALIKPNIQRRSCPPRAPAAAALAASVTADESGPSEEVNTGDEKKRKRCEVCPTKHDIKTSTMCAKCRKFICKKHTFAVCTQCQQ
nr:piggyBac transposable element-derived protein 4-like [Misgurnus anguillicaudatus]